jgi:hypothetical protein
MGEWTVMFLDNRHHPGALFDRVAPLSVKDAASHAAQAWQKTRQKQGKNLGFTLLGLFLA